MVAGTRGKFECESCGKSLVWKPELAGKRVKCSCGTVMTVPAAPLAAVAAAAPRKKPLQAPPPDAQVATAPPLPYVAQRKRVSESDAILTEKLIDPTRDIYVPTGVLVFGFLAIGLWALFASGINPQMSMLALGAALVSTMIKTIIMVLICVVIAGRHGEVSFGTLWPAVLKISSIVLINDAMLVWFEAWQIYRGAIEIRHGVMYIDIWLLVWEVFMSTFLIVILLLYLFEVEKEQVFQIAGPIAIASMAVGLGLRFALAWAVNAYTASTMPPPTPPPAPPPTTAPAPIVAASQPASQPVVPESAKDKAIRARIASGEIKEYYTYQFHGSYQGPLLKKLFEARPRNMYVETRAFLTPKLYVELPVREDRRAACFEAYRDYVNDGGGMEIDPNEEKDIGQKFLVIRLPK